MKEKKKLLIGLVILVVVSLLTLLLLYLFKSNKEAEPVNISSGSFKEITSDNEYFTLQGIINNYYDILESNNAKDMIDVLDEKYMSVKGINSSNVLSSITIPNGDASFVLKNAYCSNSNINQYCALNGYMISVTMEDSISYVDSLSFFATINKNSHTFKIYPLDTWENWSSFVNKYDYNQPSSLKSSYEDSNITLENKIKIYINEYMNLLYLNPEKAYEMLGEKSKKVYNTFDKFKLDIEYIYNNLSPTVFSYKNKTNNSKNYYYIMDNSQNPIEIIEDSPMNYTLDMEFN